MSTSPLTVTTESTTGTDTCPVCEHGLAAHSAISLRFCRATASQGLAENRRCICSTFSEASY